MGCLLYEISARIQRALSILQTLWLTHRVQTCISATSRYMEQLANAGEINPQFLISPAPIRHNLHTWLPRFLADNSSYKPRVDILAIHWYNPNATRLR
jgi:hypothetical protein